MAQWIWILQSPTDGKFGINLAQQKVDMLHLGRWPSLQLLNMDKDKESFIDLHEFVVGYSKAPEQPQSSTRPISHPHAMTRTGLEPATIHIQGFH